MTILNIPQSWVFAFGVFGNIISFMVYLAPIPTFYRIVKKKSTEGFQCFPYLVALFSAMIWMYYGHVKKGAFLLMIINSIGCVIETIYISIYFAYAPKKARMTTLKQLLLIDVAGISAITIASEFITHGAARVHLLGWISLIFSGSVFAAPLSIMRKVIRTKSVEFMPFLLSLFLTLSAVMWFFYGMLQMDYYIALPNTVGFLCGIAQMILYMVYKNYDKRHPNVDEKQLPTYVKDETNMNAEIHPDCSAENKTPANNEQTDANADQNKHKHTDSDVAVANQV